MPLIQRFSFDAGTTSEYRVEGEARNCLEVDHSYGIRKLSCSGGIPAPTANSEHLNAEIPTFTFHQFGPPVHCLGSNQTAAAVSCAAAKGLVPGADDDFDNSQLGAYLNQTASVCADNHCAYESFHPDLLPDEINESTCPGGLSQVRIFNVIDENNDDDIVSDQSAVGVACDMPEVICGENGLVCDPHTFCGYDQTVANVVCDSHCKFFAEHCPADVFNDDGGVKDEINQALISGNVEALKVVPCGTFSVFEWLDCTTIDQECTFNITLPDAQAECTDEMVICPDGLVLVTDAETTECRDCELEVDDCDVCAPLSHADDDVSCQDCADFHFVLDGICAECILGCRNCEDASSCQSCGEDLFLHAGTPSCIDFDACQNQFGFFPSVASGGDGINECLACAFAFPCADCTDAETCVSCTSPWYLTAGGGCVEECPPEEGFYIDQGDDGINRCLSCNDTCSICEGSANFCLSCPGDNEAANANGECVQCDNEILELGPCEECDNALEDENKPYCTECNNNEFHEVDDDGICVRNDSCSSLPDFDCPTDSACIIDDGGLVVLCIPQQENCSCVDTRQDNCEEGCQLCTQETNTCLQCDDYFRLRQGQCYPPCSDADGWQCVEGQGCLDDGFCGEVCFIFSSSLPFTEGQ